MEPGAFRRFVLPALFVGALFYVLFDRRPGPPDALTASGRTMGTSFTVKVVSAGTIPPEKQKAFRDAVADALDAVDGSMSTWRPDSGLAKLNKAGTEPVKASAQLRAVLLEAKRTSELSDGAFDVTVGPLVNAWGFGPAKKAGVPDESTLSALRARVGFAKLEIDPTAGTVRKQRADVYVDLSAIAKGYAVDRVALALEGLGFEHYMVELGGEVRVKGHNDRAKPWSIGVERPIGGQDRPVQQAISLSAGAVATSGDYRNFYEKDGKRLSHTVDPRTGRPVEHALASVTVVTETCMRADALATAITVLGPDAGLQLALRQKVAVLMLVRDGKGGFEARSTPAFKALGATPKN